MMAAITRPSLNGAPFARRAVTAAAAAAPAVDRSFMAGTASARNVSGMVNSSDQLAGSRVPFLQPYPQTADLSMRDLHQ